jgi:hypothetical protein
VEDNETAARLARNANAALAIRGTAQVVGENVRLTAQLIDSKTGGTLRTGLVTGSMGELLALEDELAGQLSGATGTAATSVAPAATRVAPATTPVVAVTAPAAAPAVIVINPPQPVYDTTYPYPYGYPYGWSYSYGYYPTVLYRVTSENRRHVRESDGREGGRRGPPMADRRGDYNPFGLPLPNTNVLPLPTNNVQPLPTNNVLPLPRNNVQPLPTNNVLPLPRNNVLPLPTNRTGSVPAIAPSLVRVRANQSGNFRRGN